MSDVINIDPRDIERKIKRFKGFIPLILVVAAALIVLITGLYMVDASEEALILRFGKYIGKTKPGLHFKIPFGIDDAIKIPVTRVFKEEFGFRTSKAGVQTEYQTGSFDDESLMLTGDLNIGDVEWIVQYKIQTPEDFVFNIRDPRKTLRDMSETVMRRVVGDRTVNEVLTVGRAEIEEVAQKELQNILDTYETGMNIVTVKLQDVNPPEPVKPSFNDVNEAKQDKEKYIEQAWSEYNKQIPKAQGQAEKTISEAEGYALNRVNSARGDVERFLEIWGQYRLAKDVTRRRLYLETLRKVLPEVQEIYVVDEEQQSLLPLLDLNKAK